MVLTILEELNSSLAKNLAVGIFINLFPLPFGRIGKRFLTLKLKDLENYISSRAKRGNMLPQGYRKVDRIIEEIENISTDEN